MIDKLGSNQIFVFGSNLAGRHGRGAALQARTEYGAVYGVGEGLQGQSYAFPTLDFTLQQLDEEGLKRSVNNLYWCCRLNPSLEFLLTKVGCGLAGFTEEYMKKFFPKENICINLTLPDDWK